MKRVVIAIVALAPLAIVATTAACTEGTTPDCSLPGTQCAPDLDGSFPDVARDDAADDVLPIDTGAHDAADAGDAADAPRDAPGDVDARG